jgi:hypothetical protein
MPQSEPGSLSAMSTAEIVAYILNANQLPAGDAALAEDVDVLRRIRMDVAAP